MLLQLSDGDIGQVTDFLSATTANGGRRPAARRPGHRGRDQAAADDAFDAINRWLGIEGDPLPLCLPRSRARRVL
jgi:hypothetical protein